MTLATALVAFAAVCGPALAATGAQLFIKDAIQGDNSEVLLGQLGQEKGSTDQVRQFGEMLVSDHGSAKMEALEVAKQVNVSPMDTPKPAAVEVSQKLTKLSGINFDRAFLEAMIDDHKKDIAAYTEQAEANSGPVSAMAAKQLPMLRDHLRMAQDLQGSKTGGAEGASTDRIASMRPEGLRAWRSKIRHADRARDARADGRSSLPSVRQQERVPPEGPGVGFVGVALVLVDDAARPWRPLVTLDHCPVNPTRSPFGVPPSAAAAEEGRGTTGEMSYGWRCSGGRITFTLHHTEPAQAANLHGEAVA